MFIISTLRLSRRVPCEYSLNSFVPVWAKKEPTHFESAPCIVLFSKILFTQGGNQLFSLCAELRVVLHFLVIFKSFGLVVSALIKSSDSESYCRGIARRRFQIEIFREIFDGVRQSEKRWHSQRSYSPSRQL